MNGRRAHALAFGAVALAVLLAYLPCLDGEFQFDDALGFERGGWRMPEGKEGAALAWTLANWSNRGLVHASYQLNYWLAGGKGSVLSMNYGGNPLALTLSFHLFNVLAHLLAASGLYAVLAWAAPRLASPAVLTPALGSALLALHPLASESVAYTSARSGTLAAAFGLWGIAGFLRFGAPSRDGAGRPLLSRALGLALLLLGTRMAVGCKETGWAVPFLGAALLAWAYRNDRGALRKDWRRILWIGLPGLVLAGWLVLAKMNPLTPPPMHPLSGLRTGPLLAAHGATQLHAWTTLLLPRFAFPAGPWHPTVDPDARILGPGWTTALEASAVLLTVFWARRRAWAALALAWGVLGALPSSAPILLDVTAERHAYLPLVAAALGVAPFLARRRGWAAVLLLCAGGLTCARASEWRTEWGLWRSAVRDAPGRPRPRYNLAKTDVRMSLEADLPRAALLGRSGERQLRSALAEWPGFHLALGLLGAEMERQGRLEEALAYDRLALVAHGNAMVQGEAVPLHAAQTPRIASAIGRVLERMGRGREATGDFQAIVRLHLLHARSGAPERAFHLGQATLLLRLLAEHHRSGGRLEEALAALEQLRGIPQPL